MKRKKVIVRLFGGLGNQLFGYAAARRLSIVNNADLLIDNISGFEFDHVYKRQYQLDHFNIPCKKIQETRSYTPLPRISRFIKREFNRLLPFEHRRYLVQEGVDFDNRLLKLNFKKNLYIEGYWQSEAYFKDIETVIREDLRIKATKAYTNSKIASEIKQCESVAVHVRFFNEPYSNESDAPPKNYYASAINLMEKSVSKVHYFVFSNKPEHIHNILSLPPGRFTIVSKNNPAHIDLWLMSQCKHFIIANSTFSWWGAWLSTNPEKMIIAPGFEKREGNMWWGFNGLLPLEWQSL